MAVIYKGGKIAPKAKHYVQDFFPFKTVRFDTCVDPKVAVH